MDPIQFKRFRKQLNKTQKEIANLLGISIKAVHSYEQGWRSIPPSVERQLLFLVSNTPANRKKQKNCWTQKNCAKEVKYRCPAWEFQTGRLCWFINGTICSGQTQGNWQNKMEICRTCVVFNNLFDPA